MPRDTDVIKTDPNFIQTWNEYPNLGQWTYRSLATWMATYDRPNYDKFGGHSTLYTAGQYNQVAGQVDADTERAQLADALIVANYLSEHPADFLAEQLSLK